MEFYSAMKKKTVLSFSGKWMKLVNVMLSEISQTQKVKVMFSVVCECWREKRKEKGPHENIKISRLEEKDQRREKRRERGTIGE